jgi:hypothetical protein
VGSSRLRILGTAAAVIAVVIAAANARGDDRATAEGILGPIERDAAHKDVTAEAVKHARDALERATRMRDTNDEARARLSESLGLRWAEVARDLVRASDAEQAAAKARSAADDAGAHADRERSLLEEAIARQGRLRAELEGLDRAKQGPDRTSHLGASLDGGAPTRGASSAARPGPPPPAGGRARGGSGAMPTGDAGAVDAGGLLP